MSTLASSVLSPVSLAQQKAPRSWAGKAAKPLRLPRGLPPKVTERFHEIFFDGLALALIEQPALDRSLTAANAPFIVADDLRTQLREYGLPLPPGFSPESNDAITVSFETKKDGAFTHLILIQSSVFKRPDGIAKGALVIQHELFSVQRREIGTASDDTTQEAYQTYQQSIAAAEKLVSTLTKKGIAPQTTAQLRYLIPDEKRLMGRLGLELAQRIR